MDSRIPTMFDIPVPQTEVGQDTYLYFVQCNLMKSNNASNELGIHLNRVMTKFKYKNQDEAYFINNHERRDIDNYKLRMQGIGCEINDHDEVISRPKAKDKHLYKASYKKMQARIASQNLGGGDPAENQFRQSAAKLRALSQKIEKEKVIPSLDPSRPFGFVCGIQEPYFHYKKIPGLKGHTVLIDASVAAPRAAIFHSKELHIWPVAEFTGRDICTGMLITPDNRKIYITSVYFAGEIPPEDMFMAELELLLRQVKKDKAELVFMADVNAYSTALWNSKTTNPRGERFEIFALQHNLRVLNQGNRFTYVRYNAQSRIDCSLVSPGLVDSVEHWKVEDAIAYSDHCSIRFLLKVQSLKTELKWNFRKMNKEKFKFLMEGKSDPLFNAELKLNEMGVTDLDLSLEQYYKDLQEALEETCPKCPVKYTIPGFEWYQKDHKELEKRMKYIRNYVKSRALKKEQSNDPNFDLLPARYTEKDYRDARNEYRKECRNSKKHQHRANLDGKTRPVEVAQLKRGLMRSSAPEPGLLKKDGILQDEVNSVKLLADTFFPGNEPSARKDKRTKRSIKIQIDDIKSQHITSEKVAAAIKSFQPFKSPGPDMIPPFVLQQMGGMAIERLTRLFKASYLLKYVPPTWLAIRVVFIPKADKKTYSEPRSYRPISLMCFMFKTMEKILLWDNEDKVLSNNPLHEKQHGFRKGKSTCSALTSLVGQVEYALVNRNAKGFALAVFLDIEGAYDHLLNGSIVRALKARGCDPGYIDWSLDFLKFRKVQIDYKGVNMTVYPRKGAPQGAVSSPYFWSDAHDTFLKLFDNDKNVNVECYADDCALIVTGNNLNEMRNFMQKAIEKSEDWARIHGMKFAPSKTDAIIFTRKQVKSKNRPNGWENPKKLQISKTEIKFSNLVRYLGVWLDPKLSFKGHLGKRVNAAKGVLHKMSSAMGKFWGISPQLALWTWLGIARPMITHGSIVWGHVSSEGWAMKLLTSVQRLAFKLLTFFRKSTPTKGLEVILNVWPLDLHIKYLQASSWLRTKDQQVYPERLMYTDEPCLKGHRQMTEEWIYSLNCNGHHVTMSKLDDIPRKFIWNSAFRVDMASLKVNPDDKKKEKFGKPKFDSMFAIFTDGSSADGFSGVGICPMIRETTAGGYRWRELSIEQIEGELYLGCTPIFFCELYGIYRASQYITHNYQKFLGEKVVIYTDNQSVLHSLQAMETSSSLVYQTYQSLNLASDTIGKPVVIRWVKGHAGHIGNEMADARANAGRLKPSHIVDPLPLPTRKSLKALIAAGVNREWNKRWQEEETCRQTKQWFPVIRPNMSAWLLTLGRRALSEHILVFTGHNFWNRHNWLIDKARLKRGEIEEQDLTPPFCDLCLKEVPEVWTNDLVEYVQTTWHIFTECEALAVIRYRVFGHWYGMPLPEVRRQDVVKFLRQAQLSVFPSDQEEVMAIDRSIVLQNEDDIINND